MRKALELISLILFPGREIKSPPTPDRDWRLRAVFDMPNGVANVFNRLRRRERILGSEVGGLLPSGTDLSRRNKALLVYAPTRSAVDTARATIERVASTTGLSVDVRIDRWDERLRGWRQVDPPLLGQERELDEARMREVMRQETREVSCLVGRLDRTFVEGPLRDFAHSRGLACSVEEKPRLLSVRLTFSVTGPAYELDEFADYFRIVLGFNRHVTLPEGG